MFSHDLADELYEHEYPMISAAYRTAEHEEPMFDPVVDLLTPIVSSPAQFDQMTRWGDNLVNKGTPRSRD
jgi:hypothetical protein